MTLNRHCIDSFLKRAEQRGPQLIKASPDISRIACCDRGYDRPSGRPRVSNPATYRSGTPRVQRPVIARWHGRLHGLATSIREISGLEFILSYYGFSVLAYKMTVTRRFFRRPSGVSLLAMGRVSPNPLATILS